WPDLISERVVAKLRHDDVLVRLRRAADTFEREALRVGILRADLDRPERALVQGVIEAARDLPHFLRVAVALGRRRVFDVASAMVVERISEAERRAIGA